VICFDGQLLNDAWLLDSIVLGCRGRNSGWARLFRRESYAELDVKRIAWTLSPNLSATSTTWPSFIALPIRKYGASSATRIVHKRTLIFRFRHVAHPVLLLPMFPMRRGNTIGGFGSDLG
jgi:hypothetical protein